MAGLKATDKIQGTHEYFIFGERQAGEGEDEFSKGKAKVAGWREKNGNLAQLFLTIVQSLLLPFSLSPRKMGYNHHLIAFCDMYR